jgi:hypothetical protein
MQGCTGAVPTEALIRDKVEFTLTLPVGKLLTNIKNNGVSIMDYVTVNGKEVSVTMPIVFEDVNLAIELEDKSFTVTIHAVDNATITASTLAPKAHEDVTLQLSVDEGYVYEYVKVNGVEVRLQADGSYVIEGVLEDIVVEYSVVAIDEPGTDDPGTDNPGTDEPGTDNPSEKPSNEGVSGGCFGNISNMNFALMALMVCAAGCIVKSKEKNNESNKEKGTN